MRTAIDHPRLTITVLGLLAGAIALVLAVGPGPQAAKASSHREAPLIANDPTADNTDVYAFVSPDRPDTVTMIANYIPLEEPAGGPNFFNFDDNVLYEIKVDNNGDGEEDVTYQFRFRTETRNQNTFLYNTGPINSLDDPNWNIYLSWGYGRYYDPYYYGYWPDYSYYYYPVTCLRPYWHYYPYYNSGYYGREQLYMKVSGKP